ncbi:MAG: helix-turn-helix transcriptional regulator [Desulfovermiculus sp.]|nr:helix-turn-helix transcriptional regulator [Desulfovermiculus sp.]
MISKIKAIMNEKNVTIRQLEQDSGLNNVTILRARKDETIIKCTLETLAKIAAALGVSTKDLYDENDENMG